MGMGYRQHFDIKPTIIYFWEMEKPIPMKCTPIVRLCLTIGVHFKKSVSFVFNAVLQDEVVCYKLTIS